MFSSTKSIVAAGALASLTSSLTLKAQDICGFDPSNSFEQYSDDIRQGPSRSLEDLQVPNSMQHRELLVAVSPRSELIISKRTAQFLSIEEKTAIVERGRSVLEYWSKTDALSSAHAEQIKQYMETGVKNSKMAQAELGLQQTVVNELTNSAELFRAGSGLSAARWGAIALTWGCMFVALARLRDGEKSILTPVTAALVGTILMIGATSSSVACKTSGTEKIGRVIDLINAIKVVEAPL